jgi:hypothetical protein
MVLDPLEPFGRSRFDVAIADDLAAPVADRGGVIGASRAERIDERLDVPAQRVDDRSHAAADVDEEHDVGHPLGLRARLRRGRGRRRLGLSS